MVTAGFYDARRPRLHRSATQAVAYHDGRQWSIHIQPENADDFSWHHCNLEEYHRSSLALPVMMAKSFNSGDSTPVAPGCFFPSNSLITEPSPTIAISIPLLMTAKRCCKVKAKRLRKVAQDAGGGLSASLCYKIYCEMSGLYYTLHQMLIIRC